GIAIDHAVGQVCNDAAKIRRALADNGLQLIAHIGPETRVVTMPALAVAGIGEDVIDGFHLRLRLRFDEPNRCGQDMGFTSARGSERAVAVYRHALHMAAVAVIVVEREML